MKPKNLQTLKLAALSKQGFTLMETIIAIVVLAVLLSGFLTVFTPAAQGIRRSISSQQADRLTSTLERDLVTLRKGAERDQYSTGFEKAFEWIKNANDASTAVFVYQYRADTSASMRVDGTPEPMDSVDGLPGSAYSVQSIARQADDLLFVDDLTAIDGSIFYVKFTQLVYEDDQLVLGNPGEIVDPISGDPIDTAEDYPEAIITFSAAFHSVPSKSFNYITGEAFEERFISASKPIFTRNLAIRR